MISAPHAVNHFREGQSKAADMLTGALALYFQEVCGCHIIYKGKSSESDPNYDSNDNGENIYQSRLKEYVEQNDIKVLIDLHGAAKDKPYAVEMGTAPTSKDDKNDPSLNGHPFIADLIRYSLEYAFHELEVETKEVWKNIIFSAGMQNTVTKFISRNTPCACIQIEINRQYRDFTHPELLLRLIDAFTYIIEILRHLDWTAEKTQAFRLWQSNLHKPQDKIETCAENGSPFQYNKLLHIMSHLGETEMVRLHKATAVEINKMHQSWQEEGCDSPARNDSEYLFLTNRLIENLWHREWIQGEEIFPALRGIPVVVYETKPNTQRMGMVKANQVDTIGFSSNLYETLLPDADRYNFIIFNRSTDSRLYIDFSKADYKDHGRIKEPRVMIPRYYKNLLGYLDCPLPVVRKEELDLVVDQIIADTKAFLEEIYLFDGNHFQLDRNRLKGSKFYQLLAKLNINIDAYLAEQADAQWIESARLQISEKVSGLLTDHYQQRADAFYEYQSELHESTEECTSEDSVTEIEKHYGWYDFVEIIKTPKKASRTSESRLRQSWDKLRQRMLRLIIGKTEYYMQTVYTNETDDKNNVSRLSRNMMNLLGVSENDKVVIKYGPRSTVVRVLEGENYTDSKIGIPAPVRKTLGMNSIHDIVIIYRDMGHIFKRHSQEQTVAIIGTVLAVFQVMNDLWIGALLCALFIPLILYFALNEERIKVK